MSEITTNMDYKETLHLPNTAFPMKANLSQRELETLRFWENINLYQKLEKRGADKPTFVLLDGPPYANGPIHIGHAVNKILKDFIIKSKTLSGFYAPFLPGWDCHGLPIELNVENKLGKAKAKAAPKNFRAKCREYVLKQVDIQREAFVRLGVLGDWSNPCLTMDYAYEADTIRALASIIRNGHLHKGYKPVHWCVDCGSSLAEAEVEYQDKTSSAIDVSFPVIDQTLFKVFPGLSDAHKTLLISIVIWTTTPWTLPANEAVAVHPEYVYALLLSQQGLYIVAADLAQAFAERVGLEKVEILATCLGAKLEGIELQHPFYLKRVPIILGTHVTLETGTGCVHTAPAHGQEDYNIGERYQLPVDNPVDSDGRYLPTTALFAGELVLNANDKMIALLRARHHLLSAKEIVHSYPHCWRHKTPLIFRATPQWFIGMEAAGLRDNLLRAIQTVEWIPAWGQARISAMVEGRPDWCISRQRTWGVPLCLWVHKQTGDLHPKTLEWMEIVADRVEKEGIDAWYDFETDQLLGQKAEQYEKNADVLDVWLDAGVMHSAAPRKQKSLKFPADLYLEGSDQHRGWFLSSLTTAVAMKNQAPYRQVLTHGFTVDAQGRKMSKSLGNVVAPEKVVETLGADVLRLWVAATDYRAEMVVSDDILKQTSDIYRRIRNTARFLLANLHGFDPLTQIVPSSEMLALDRFIVERARLLQETVTRAYQEYHFHVIYQEIHNFCAIELGGFYLDIIKDRQYTGKKQGRPRLSAQTALYYIIEALVRWIAPILSFTAEEIWQYIPGPRESSVFLSEWYSNFPTFDNQNANLAGLDQTFWQSVLTVRNAVNQALEGARAEGQIGSGLEAEVDLYCDEPLYARLSKLENEMRFVLITSRADIFKSTERPSLAKASGLEGLWLVVQASSHPKCARCWHRRPEVDQNTQYPKICGRCVENIAGTGEMRQYA